MPGISSTGIADPRRKSDTVESTAGRDHLTAMLDTLMAGLA
jgi:hypothetical protein